MFPSSCVENRATAGTRSVATSLRDYANSIRPAESRANNTGKQVSSGYMPLSPRVVTCDPASSNAPQGTRPTMPHQTHACTLQGYGDTGHKQCWHCSVWLLLLLLLHWCPLHSGSDPHSTHAHVGELCYFCHQQSPVHHMSVDFI